MSAPPGHHSLPVFEGVESCHHTNVPLWKLRLQALPVPWGPTVAAESFVQFVGFPRSGHSLIGALIDAHPEAVIAHELNAMGFIRDGFSYRQIARLARRNAAQFAEDGKWWNGYSYAVPGAPPPSSRPKVIGDKKGDGAARWCAEEPGLLDRLAASGAPSPKWILVTRAPADNIATMTLRVGRTYDRIRIDAVKQGRSASDALSAAQRDGTLPVEASDKMIADYRFLCVAIAQMKAAISPDDWLEVDYDAFTSAAEQTLRQIAAFLGLTPDADWIAAGAGVVRASPGRSRDRLSWSADQHDALHALARDFDFLTHYGDPS